MRKTLSLLIVACMLFSTSITVFAESSADQYFQQYEAALKRLWDEVDDYPAYIRIEELDVNSRLYYFSDYSRVPLAVAYGYNEAETSDDIETVGIVLKGAGDENDFGWFLHGVLTAIYLSDNSVNNAYEARALLERVIYSNGSYSNGDIKYSYYIDTQNNSLNFENSTYYFLIQVSGLSQSSSNSSIGGVSVGDIVTFGSYEQDNNLSNGKEAIEWLVLDIQDGKALLLSKYGLETKEYNTGDYEITWERSTLRSR